MPSEFKLLLTWAQPEDLVAHFISQATYEGLDVSDEIKMWQAAGGTIVAPAAGAASAEINHAMREVAQKLVASIDAKMQSNPEIDYAKFLDALPDVVKVQLPQDDTYYGAWIGRAAGCLLGKPVEKVYREGIREILQSSNRWPLNDYFTSDGVPQHVLQRHPWNSQSFSTCLQENIDGMAEDDDMNYSVTALMTLEKFGRDFNTDHVAKQWLDYLPAGLIYTAERVAYRNLLDGIAPMSAGAVRNPFKEWIGALIRVDVYGWINPGNPKLAAQMAVKDAWLSHRRNGLYGAAMYAAMCATAMVSKDIDAVLDAGFSVVPPDSHTFAACNYARILGQSDFDYESALDKLYHFVDGMHWVHTVNNAALGVLALSRSRGDFSKAITLTVMGGWDTDSIGASVGSICGAMVGASGIDSKWTAPIDDRLASSIPGCDGLKLSQLAKRTRALAQ